jgi:hypothetical protein
MHAHIVVFSYLPGRSAKRCSADLLAATPLAASESGFEMEVSTVTL